MKTEHWRRMHPDGSVTEGCLVDGRPQGDFRELFPSGQLRRHYHYERGLLHGTQKQFDPNGKCIAEFSMKYGAGIYLECWDSGLPKFKEEVVIDVEGISGVSTFYRPDGRKLSTQYYLNGEKVTRKMYVEALEKESNQQR